MSFKAVFVHLFFADHAATSAPLFSGSEFSNSNSDSEISGPDSECLRAVPEIILGGGGGPQHFFCPVGGGCFVDSVSEGWGVGSNLSWGSRHI